MTPEAYYVEIKKLGLSPTDVPTVFRDSDGNTQRVPIPHRMTPQQRVQAVEMVKFLMGLGPRPF